MKKVIFVLAAILFASSAKAWGDREQSALQGIAGTLLLQQIYRNSYPPIYQPQPVPQTQPQPIPIPPVAIPYPVYPPIVRQVCRQVLAIHIDRFGNEYRYPITVCN